MLFVAALLLTLTVHLQWAIIGAALLSLAAFVVDSGRHGDLKRVVRDDPGYDAGR